MFIKWIIAAATAKAKHRTQIYHLGTSEFVPVNDSVRWICGALGLKLRDTDEDCGWIGDNSFIFLDMEKSSVTGWKPKLTIEQGNPKAFCWRKANCWIYATRKNSIRN